MGGIEIAAALLGVINVLLVVRRSIWNYPFGIVMVSLYFFVFWHAKLYSDSLLQIFFLLIQVYGWWAWLRSPQVDHGVAVEWMRWRQRLSWLGGACVFILVWGTGMARYTDAAAPYADATIAGLSVAAQILQSLRRVESWVLWIAVDVFAVGLFIWRGLDVTAGLYALFFILAVIGLLESGSEGEGMKRGFILGKFMPPHAGHVTLINAARAMVDELTILVCSLPDDPIPGEDRLRWMRELFPTCRIAWQSDVVPQQPSDSAKFWTIWRNIVANAHPEPIDYVFAGEAYGADLAREVGGFFVPLGARVLDADQRGLGGLSGEKIRSDPWRYWEFLPAPVRNHYALTICLHGVESVGKSMLSERLAQHYRTIVVPEYGRTHCETHGTDCREADLLLIGEAQQAMIEAARPWCNRLLIADTDALMTAAWSQMMIGYLPDQLICHRKADLYLVLGTDAPFVDDGTRVYGEPEVRVRFDRVARDALRIAQTNVAEIAGSWDQRFADSCVAIDKLIEAKGWALPRKA